MRYTVEANRPQEGFYLIEEAELVSLLSDSLKLTALDHSGVNNWEWYGEFFDEYLASVYEEYRDRSKERERELTFNSVAELMLAGYKKVEKEEEPPRRKGKDLLSD